MIRVDVGVSTWWQQPAAVSTTRAVENSFISTALSVEPLVGEAGLPFPVQPQIHSERTWRWWRLARLAPERTSLRLRLLALSSILTFRLHHIRCESNGSSSRALDGSLPLHHPTCS